MGRRATWRPVAFDTGDALAFMSSNAATLAEAVLACSRSTSCCAASHVVAALSFIALGGSPEAYATPVHVARPHPGPGASARREMRGLLGMLGAPTPGRRIQDPLRPAGVPAGAGPALDAGRTCGRC